MWQLSNLQIDSSVIQIVQSDVLRNSVDTTAAITNMATAFFVSYMQVSYVLLYHLCFFAAGCCINQRPSRRRDLRLSAACNTYVQYLYCCTTAATSNCSTWCSVMCRVRILYCCCCAALLIVCYCSLLLLYFYEAMYHTSR